MKRRLPIFSAPCDRTARALQALCGRRRLAGARSAPARRRLMAGIMGHFRIDMAQAVERHWDELRRAELSCADCAKRRRCCRWQAWGRSNDAPLAFCRNAELFLAIAEAQGRRA